MSYGFRKMRQRLNWQLTALILTGMVSGHASAEEVKQEQEFSLNPLIVTAQRYEKADLDTPASTKVYTNEQLQATGANTVWEALKFSEGIIYQAQGPAGQSQGAMTSQILIRGQARGTLVLVDGIPLNLRGTFSLEDMAVGDVEKIEIIRGGGSVLYGSNATGGVINIITKKERTNSVQVTYGNYGKQKHAVSFQAGKLGVGTSFEKLGEIKGISGFSTRPTASDKYYDFLGSEKHMLSYTYRFDDNWLFSQSYSENSYGNRYNYATTSVIDSYTDYDTTQNRMSLRYDNNGWQGTAYVNYRKLYNDKLTWKTQKHAISDVRDQVVGFEMQKDWMQGRDNYLLGLSLQDESYEKAPTSVSRNIYSAFGQWNHPFNNQTDITLSARETWTGGAPDDKDYNEFTPQVQLLHKLDDKTSWYASAGKSFTMPTFSQIYGASIDVIGNPNVKPQVGKHYETGLKRINGGHAWKLALFKSDIENYITTKSTTEPWYVTNEDSKNAGIELSCEIVGKNGWSSNWGVSYGNPQSREISQTGTVGDWQRQYGRLQLNGGVRYQQDKWNASLQGNYLGKRVMSSDQSDLRPLFATSIHVSYKPEKQREIYLNVENLLDRKDITTHSSSRYYALPINYELGYRVAF